MIDKTDGCPSFINSRSWRTADKFVSMKNEKNVDSADLSIMGESGSSGRPLMAVLLLALGGVIGFFILKGVLLAILGALMRDVV